MGSTYNCAMRAIVTMIPMIWWAEVNPRDYACQYTRLYKVHNSVRLTRW